MFSSLFVTLTVAACAFAASTPAQQVAALKSAASNIDRLKILDQDTDVSEATSVFRGAQSC